MKAVQGKRVQESQVTVQHQVLPHQTNNAGKMHGGELLRLLDSAGAICAFRHSRGLLVTAAIEHMDFIAPIHPGDIVMFHCSVNAVRRTSMEVGVRIEAEEYLTGEVRHVSTSYMTFVGINDKGDPRPLPALIAETDDEKRRMAGAARRMTISRMMRGASSKATVGHSLRELPHVFSFGQMDAATLLPTLPVEKIFALVRSDTSLFCVLRETDMRELVAKGHVFAFSEIRHGYCCLTFTDKLNPASVGIVASISAVLASTGIEVFLYSTLQTNFLFFPEDQRQKAHMALAAVGYLINNT